MCSQINEERKGMYDATFWTESSDDKEHNEKEKEKDKEEGHESQEYSQRRKRKHDNMELEGDDTARTNKDLILDESDEDMKEEDDGVDAQALGDEDTRFEDDFFLLAERRDLQRLTATTRNKKNRSMKDNQSGIGENQSETETEKEIRHEQHMFNEELKNESRRRGTLTEEELSVLLEVFHEFLKAEPNHPHQCQWNEPQKREQLVAWLIELGEPAWLNLTDTTVHLAVSFLDRINQKFVDPEKLTLASIACLSIASKQNENETNLPSFARLHYITGERYSVQLINRMEIFVLNELGWDLMKFTAISVLDNMVERGACTFNTEQELHQSDVLPAERVAMLEDCLIGYARLFCDLVLQDYQLSQEKHSLVAAAALVCSRRALKVTPPWTERLEQITCYSFDSIQHYAAKLWEKYCLTFGLGSPD